ncbi:MAG: carbohydrate-binding family 9-like protein [Acidobacteriota bacterium]
MSSGWLSRPLVRSVDGGRPRWPTTVSLAWSPRALHVRFDCRDERAWATLEGRDDPLWREEVVEAFLAPAPADGGAQAGRGPASYVELEVNPLGALFDARVHNPDGDRATMRVDAEWNWPGIRWRVGRTGQGDDWWATLELPWRGLELEEGLPGLWFANFYRVERPAGPAGGGESDEYSAWSPTYADPPDFHVPSRFGLVALDGLARPSPTRRTPLAIVPQRKIDDD